MLNKFFFTIAVMVGLAAPANALTIQFTFVENENGVHGTWSGGFFFSTRNSSGSWRDTPFFSAASGTLATRTGTTEGFYFRYSRDPIGFGPGAARPITPTSTSGSYLYLGGSSIQFSAFPGDTYVSGSGSMSFDGHTFASMGINPGTYVSRVYGDPEYDQSIIFTFERAEVVAPVPLPASLPLLLAALGGVGLWARRSRAG